MGQLGHGVKAVDFISYSFAWCCNNNATHSNRGRTIAQNSMIIGLNLLSRDYLISLMPISTIKSLFYRD